MSDEVRRKSEETRALLKSDEGAKATRDVAKDHSPDCAKRIAWLPKGCVIDYCSCECHRGTSHPD